MVNKDKVITKDSMKKYIEKEANRRGYFFQKISTDNRQKYYFLIVDTKEKRFLELLKRQMQRHHG